MAYLYNRLKCLNGLNQKNKQTSQSQYALTNIQLSNLMVKPNLYIYIYMDVFKSSYRANNINSK